MRTTGSVTRIIAAPPHVVWGLVTDIARMGEWSPECVGGAWLDDAVAPVIGAKFLGRNQRGEQSWEVPCEVTEAEPMQAFAFHTGLVTWRYAFEAAPDGASCTVTETFNAPVLGQAELPDFIPPGRDDMLDSFMSTTLERLAAVAD